MNRFCWNKTSTSLGNLAHSCLLLVLSSACRQFILSSIIRFTINESHRRTLNKTSLACFYRFRVVDRIDWIDCSTTILSSLACCVRTLKLLQPKAAYLGSQGICRLTLAWFAFDGLICLWRPTTLAEYLQQSWQFKYCCSFVWESSRCLSFIYINHDLHVSMYITCQDVIHMSRAIRMITYNGG